MAGAIIKSFGGDAPEEPLTLWHVAARALLVYVLGLFLVRVGKSRFHGRPSAIDLVLGFILGSLLSRGITGSASISETFVASAVLISLHWLATAAACRSHRIGNLIKGHERLLVADGRVLRENMLGSHISERDIIEAMHLAANIDDLSMVKAAYKERSGLISIVLYPPKQSVPPSNA